ncbi:hypothetical protein GEU84_001190 [Fertoebacter nigrum]|uniref:DUF4209 domain-containing protein n=1 Tax=Fertoeibacter niger TaxID=2656921 RepID=A0A8X8GX07_9RHOB|nr:DUF4209 domain-containing protein [Fertoeibacter niger]NUB42986.1 hypothetical protein [Fertoeibacter niger]
MAGPDDRPAFALLAALTNYHFDPDNRTEPFRPKMVFGDRRSLVPTDMMVEQITELWQVAPSVMNLGLRARIADVVWFLQRRRMDMAELAIQSYCECVISVRDGTATQAHGNESPWSMQSVMLLVRAASISHATKWSLASSDNLRSLVGSLVQAAYDRVQPGDFCRIAHLDLDHKISAVDQIAQSAEQLANHLSLAEQPDQRMDLWKIAARAHRIQRNQTESDRCNTSAAECLVQKSDQSVGSAMLQSSFLHDAITSLRGIRGTGARRAELEAKLRAIQPTIREEMGEFSHEIDLTEIVEHALATVRGHSLPKAILALAKCDKPPTPAVIRKTAVEHISSHPLQGMMPMQVYDYQGHVVFRSPGSGGTPEESEHHTRYMMCFHRNIARQLAVAGAINPIRRTIADEHPVSMDELIAVLENSPFIPPGHVHIFARGMFHFLAGEDIEAASVLMPQLENSLRHLLLLKGIETSVTDDFGIQTEASLSILLNPNGAWRSKIDEILPPRYAHEIDLLFLFAGGPGLRNQVAHGKIPAGEFWDHNMVYGVWMILHLALAPLITHWEHVETLFVNRTGLGK